MAATPPNPPRASKVVSSETGLDADRLKACCDSVPGLPPVVATLTQIYTDTERVSWNKAECRKLSLKAKSLVFIICDHYDNERAETHELQNAVGKTVQNMRDIAADVTVWADWSLFKSWYNRRDINARIKHHEESLEKVTEFPPVAATLQAHDKVAALQESIKNNSADRRKAEQQLYDIRSAPPGAGTESTPPELACECVRLGIQPDHSGSRNDIWKGRWVDKADVALIVYKEYKVEHRDDNSIRRFERQIRVWRKLYHPNVLRLYGWCIFEEETYLVSPWLQNRDVVRYLAANGNRDQKSLSLIYEIAQGLQYLHSERVIHGSLKPSNILVKDDGSAVLSDFSLAKFATPSTMNTEQNPQVNVYRYQAPEVIQDQPISEASDVYSWAMTALEIVTGDPPYSTWRSPGKLMTQIITKNQILARTDYNSLVLDKHPEIWELLVRCWNREPKNRPTAKEIVEALKKIQNVNVK